jgi:signal transduction histidine kinase
MPVNTRLPARAVRAHALKNCLSIVTAVNGLVQVEASAPARGRLLRSQDAVRRMLELIEEDLLPDSDSARLPEVELVSAAQILDAVRVRVEDLAEARQVHVAFRAGPGGTRGDAHGLAEALLNIVTNAIQSSSAGTAVLVTTAETVDGGQVWTVRDNGPGIPRHLLPHVGTPFFSRRQQGSGLGIAVARDIVAQHGGHTQIESAPGLGTGVYIWLPPWPRRGPQRRTEHAGSTTIQV